MARRTAGPAKRWKMTSVLWRCVTELLLEKKKTASKESVHRRSTSDFLMEAYLHVENT